MECACVLFFFIAFAARPTSPLTRRCVPPCQPVVEILAKFEAVLRCQTAMALPGKCAEVLPGGGGGDVWHVRSKRQTVSTLVDVLLCDDVVSSVVGRIHGLGTPGNRSELRSLLLQRRDSAVVLVVALYSSFSKAVRSRVGIPRHFRIELLPAIRWDDDSHTYGLPLPNDWIDCQRLQGSRLSIIRGVAGGVRRNIQANYLGPASAGVGSHQDEH